MAGDVIPNCIACGKYHGSINRHINCMSATISALRIHLIAERETYVRDEDPHRFSKQASDYGKSPGGAIEARENAGRNRG